MTDDMFDNMEKILRENPIWKMLNTHGFKIVINAKDLKLWGVDDE